MHPAPMELQQVGRSLWLQGWKVHTYGELVAAINGAKDNLNSPFIIQVVVPQRSIPENANWKAN